MTYFPSLEEAIMLWESGVSRFYFFGEVDKEDTANFFGQLAAYPHPHRFSLVNLTD